MGCARRKSPERNIKKDDVNLSRIFSHSEATRGESLTRGSLMDESGKVAGVYVLGVEQTSPFIFEHDGKSYELSYGLDGEDGDNYMEIVLTQIDVGCCYDGRKNIEQFGLLPRGETDFIAEFQGGNMLYSPERLGKSLIAETGDGPSVDMLMHGWHVQVANLTDADFQNAYLLVIEGKLLPFCRYCSEHLDRNDMESVVWRFDLEESPEWALESNGQPPLP